MLKYSTNQNKWNNSLTKIYLISTNNLDHLNSPVSIKEIEFKVKKFTNKIHAIPGQHGFTEKFYQRFKEEL